jgi:GT2 family glycosyltransferase
MISVIIPTRNRSELLNNCLDAILRNSIKPEHIFIVDSSDFNKRKKIEYISKTVEHEFTEIKSAAKQRNIGLSKVPSDCDYVAFLDDDVLVPENYFSKLILSMEKFGYIGVSGIAINKANSLALKQKTKARRLISRLFLLDSTKNGVMLKSGINISVKCESATPIEVEWLIGCAFWNFSKIKNLRFEEDFYGQSLGEDAIFSLKASRIGKIAVDPNVILNHLESPIMRPNPYEFMRMWIVNRKRVINEMPSGILKYFAYHWANLGKLLQIILLPNANKSLELKGLLSGYKYIILGKYEN